VAALVLVSLLWGTTFVAVKSALEDASPLLFVGLRFTLAAAGSALLVRRAGDLRRALGAGIPLGVVLAAAYAAQTVGLTTTSPSRSAFITGANVALVPLWGLAWLRTRPRPAALVGLGVVMPGLWLLTAAGSRGWTSGDAWTLVCAVLFALHVVMLNRLAPGRPAGALLAVQLTVTAALALGAAPWLERPAVEMSAKLAGALVLTALLATTGTTWLQIRYQPRVDPTRAALIYATEPVFASGFSFLVLGEVLPGAAWTGAALILAGIVVSELGTGGAAGDPAGSPLGPGTPGR
jgi:drug/metabolite transporter (DMT)-like permease